MIKIRKLEYLSNENDVQIWWVSCQTGINGNDQIDKAARSTLNITTEKKGLSTINRL